jgi:hypothetical protein
LSRLGFSNLARVGLYRLGLKSGLHPVQKISDSTVSGPFFSPPQMRDGLVPRSDGFGKSIQYFGRTIADEGTPDWFCGPDSLAPADNDRAWWTIPDFDPTVGDIKTVWEASRFDWLVPMAQHAARGDVTCIDRLNTWLTDWSTHNVPYIGANWKCGQEASIRVMHLALAGLIMTPQGMPVLLPSLRKLLIQHLKRIAPTMGYAIGQANNHGTSEAAALFIGGTWLGDTQGKAWADTGRRWLENRAETLILPDGTFSQYSVTYHRVMLDTYSLASVWCARLDALAFSETLHARLSAATDWLAQMTDPISGDAPVIGANDGAHLMRLTDADYRDFRPSVQLAGAIFNNTTYFPTGPWDAQLAWLEIPRPIQHAAVERSKSFDDGGFHVLRDGTTTAYLRYPRFVFRPSQSDALHCDLWIAGRNILRDAGSFSYNVSDADTAYFNGTASHNTVQFDGRDQMPRLSRFLFGSWLSARNVILAQNSHASAGYIDAKGACHDRRIDMAAGSVTITDDISGFDTAVLRWRLIPGDWELEGTKLTGHGITLTIAGDMIDAAAIALTTGEESRYYLQKSTLPTLEVKLSAPGTITTAVHW